MNLENNVALITGAARGIGSAIADRLAREGAKLSLVDLNEDLLNVTADRLRSAGATVATFQADATDPLRAAEIVAHTADRYGRLDILVNNAGFCTSKPFLSIGVEQWQQEIEINLSASFYFARPAAQIMKDQGYGRVILIGSVCGLQGPYEIAAYGAAKSGQYGLMRAMALELAEFGITTNAVAPGPINTELLRQNLTPAMQKIAAQRVPARRIGEVDDVAQAVAFLASPASSFINGVIMPVDGGYVAAGAYMAEKLRRRLVDSPAIDG